MRCCDAVGLLCTLDATQGASAAEDCFTTSGHEKIINPPHRAHSSPRASTPPWLVRSMDGLTPIGAIGQGSSLLEYTNYLLLHPRRTSSASTQATDSRMIVSITYALPTAFLWLLFGCGFITRTSINSTAMVTVACIGVDGNILPLFGTRSHRAASRPVGGGWVVIGVHHNPRPHTTPQWQGLL